MSDVELTGNWNGVERMLSQFGQRFKRNIREATDKNGELLAGKMQQHFWSQDLGWRSLRPAYLAHKIRKGGSEQVLVWHGDLGGSIKYYRRSWEEGFVGILRNTRHSSGAPLVNLAAVHEFGSRDGRIPPRPFIGPTVEECLDEMKRNYEAAMRRAFGL